MDPICVHVDSPKVRFRKQQAWIKRNAQPRKIPKPPAIDRGPKCSGEGRIGDLSKPLRVYVKPENDPTSWVYMLKHPVKEAALNYVASGRTNELAVPLHITQKPKERKIPESALNYTPTERIISLSAPRIPYEKPKIKPQVSPGALTCNPSERIIELAKSVREEVPQKEFAFTVNPIALQYVASKRTRQMAKPRRVFTMKELLKREAEHLERKKAYDSKRADQMKRKKKKLSIRVAERRSSTEI